MSTTTSPRSPRPEGRVRGLGALAAAVALIPLAGCGATTSGADAGGSTSASSRPTTSSTPAARTDAKADCSSAALMSTLPRGASMERFTCAKAGSKEWAAAEVSPGSTVFFLHWDKTRWSAEDSDSVCGTASAGLPPSLLSYCATARPTAHRSPTVSPTRPATTEACTSAKILAALPRGASMEHFNCAPVNGKKWAAARVSPGHTVFFLQWDGRRWNAQDSSSVCGTASAGLPEALLGYCR